MDQENTGLRLLEPEAPEALVPGALLQPWIAGALLVVFGLILAWWILKRRRSGQSDPSAIREAALREAFASLDSIQAQDSRSAAVQVSLVLRKYLAQAASDPALYETHEEFISRHESLAGLSNEAKAAASDGFARLAAMKYAPEISEGSPEVVVAESRDLLETIHRGFAA